MFWELIAANKRKSFLLFAGMATLLVLLGYFIGAATMGDGGGTIGIIVATAIWVIMSAASVFGGPDLVLEPGDQLVYELHEWSEEARRHLDQLLSSFGATPALLPSIGSASPLEDGMREAVPHVMKLAPSSAMTYGPSGTVGGVNVGTNTSTVEAGEFSFPDAASTAAT